MKYYLQVLKEFFGLKVKELVPILIVTISIGLGLLLIFYGTGSVLLLFDFSIDLIEDYENYGLIKTPCQLGLMMWLMVVLIVGIGMLLLMLFKSIYEFIRDNWQQAKRNVGKSGK